MKNIFIIFVVLLVGCSEKIKIGEQPFLWEASISEEWVVDDTSEKNLLKINNDMYDIVAGITFNEISASDELDFWKKSFKNEVYQQSLGTMDIDFENVETSISGFNAIDLKYIRIGSNGEKAPINIKSRFYYYSENINGKQYSMTLNVKLNDDKADLNFDFLKLFNRVE